MRANIKKKGRKNNTHQQACSYTAQLQFHHRCHAERVGEQGSLFCQTKGAFVPDQNFLSDSIGRNHNDQIESAVLGQFFFNLKKSSAADFFQLSAS